MIHGESIRSPGLREAAGLVRARRATAAGTPLAIAVMLSGTGRTLATLLEACATGVLAGRCVVARVLASRECAGAERARAAGVPVRVMGGVIEEDELGAWLEGRGGGAGGGGGAGCDVVALAGYLRMVRVPRDWEGRMVNIHPAILSHGDDEGTRGELARRGIDVEACGGFGGPGMWGEHVHRAVLARGSRASGCTVHVVDAAFDHGPILLRRTCAVNAGDTAESLAARVFAEERRAYVEVFDALAGA